MDQKAGPFPTPIAPWHRNVLSAAAIFTVLLIAMGGVLCVTQSIRSCPDWPGCFGRIYPPLETSPILEYTHRLLALVSALLIVISAITGLFRSRSLPWIVIPPLVSIVLLLEVSYFGARVVLHGLAPGWAAVDVGSALLVVALMIASAVFARAGRNGVSRRTGISFITPFSRLVLVTAVAIYVVLLSGVLVSGKNSITGCLGWPLYSPAQFQLDAHGTADILRLALSLVAVILLGLVFFQSWRRRMAHPAVYRADGLVGCSFPARNAFTGFAVGIRLAGLPACPLHRCGGCLLGLVLYLGCVNRPQ